jgi:hypothetical protein
MLRLVLHRCWIRVVLLVHPVKREIETVLLLKPYVILVYLDVSQRGLSGLWDRNLVATVREEVFDLG